MVPPPAPDSPGNGSKQPCTFSRDAEGQLARRTDGTHLRRSLNPQWHRISLVFAAIAVSALIAWTSLQGWNLEPIGPPQQDYYNKLVAGFRKGSLALDVVVPESLKKAENPWDPDKRPPGVGLHDVSYNKGHYYLYFGVAPVVALFLPFRVLTGHDLPVVYGTLFFSIGAFLVGACLWLTIVRDLFKQAGLLTKLSGMVAIGLAGGQLVLSRRASFWEMPIAAGYYYMIWMVAAGYLALKSRRPWKWLAVSGLALGLAFGSRPTLAGGGAGLAALVIAVAAQGRESGRWRAVARRGILAATAAGLPLFAVIAGLLAYNYARFGNILEFGLNYQLTSIYEAKARHFSLSFIPFNFSVYFLKAPQWGRYFPFLHPIVAPALPHGYYGIEYVYGMFLVCPVLWWSAGIRESFRRQNAPALAGILVATALAVTIFLLSFNTAAARYTVDFLPWWVWLAVLSWAAIEDRMAARPILIRVLRAAFGFSVVVSCAFAFCASVELHGILEFLNPGAYRTLSRAFNAPVALAEVISGYQSGPVEMDVTFPKLPSGSYEPLIVTGVSYQKDFFFVYYQSATVVRLGYLSTGHPGYTSADIPVVPGRKYRIRIESGALYPPEGDLVDRGIDNRVAQLYKRWTIFEVDGVPVLRARGSWNEATPGTIQIGEDKRGNTYGIRFTGTITGVHRGAWRTPDIGAMPGGDVKLGLVLPDEVVDGVQPIALLGHTGKADILGMRMLDRKTFMLIYESWGEGYFETGPVAVDESHIALLRVRFGPALQIDGASPLSILQRTLAVWLNATPVLWTRTMVPLDNQMQFDVMGNDAGSSMSLSVFHGRLDSFAREAAPPSWRSGPYAAGEMDIAGKGKGSEPLAASGSAGKSDTLAIRWLEDGRAQILYEHSGAPVRESGPFGWDPGKVHHLRLAIPSLKALDSDAAKPGGIGRMTIDVDGARVWEADVPYHIAPASSVSIGRNSGESASTGPILSCVVLDLKQSQE